MPKLFVYAQGYKIAKFIINELLEQGIKRENIHFLGNKRQALKNQKKEGFDKLTTYTDLLPSMKRGAITGIGIAIVLLIIYYNFFYYFRYNVFIVVCLSLFGILFGVWSSSLIGVGIENDLLEEIKDHIVKGDYIISINYLTDNELDLIRNVLSNYAQATLSQKTLR